MASMAFYGSAKATRGICAYFGGWIGNWNDSSFFVGSGCLVLRDVVWST